MSITPGYICQYDDGNQLKAELELVTALAGGSDLQVPTAKAVNDAIGELDTGGTWGSITGTLAGQTDLQAVLTGLSDGLTGKVDKAPLATQYAIPVTGATAGSLAESSWSLNGATMTGPTASVISAATSLNLSSTFVGIATTSAIGSEKLGVAGDVYVSGDIIGAGKVLFKNTAGDALNTFRLEGYADTMYIVARSAVGSAVGTNVILRTALAGSGEQDQLTIDPAGKVLINSLKTAQSHPTNYKQVYVDTDTGELYRIA